MLWEELTVCDGAEQYHASIQLQRLESYEILFHCTQLRASDFGFHTAHTSHDVLPYINLVVG